jgi:hypothetical protein
MKGNGTGDCWLKNQVTMVVNAGGLEVTDSKEYTATFAGPGVRTGLLKLPKGEVATNLIEVQELVPSAHPGRNLPGWGLIFSAVDADGKESEIVSRINSTDANADRVLVGKLKVPDQPGH